MSKQIKKICIEEECWKAQKDAQFRTTHLLEKGVKHFILKRRTGEMLTNLKQQMIKSSQIKESPSLSKHEKQKIRWDDKVSKHPSTQTLDIYRN